MMTDKNIKEDKKNIQNQVMWNRLLSVVEEQGQTLIRTAFSPIVRECGDISAGIFDLDGRMMAQAVTGTPGHVNSMAESVKHFINHFPLSTMNEGDIFITNDPWMGTGHLNDFVITTPCYKDSKIVGLFSCTSHLTDIGGLGVGPDATDVHMEGLYIPMLKLADKGIMDKTLLKLIRQNTRQPVETEGDVYSLAACNDIGCKRLVEMMNDFNIDDLKDLSDFIYNKSLQAVENEIKKIPNGEYKNSMMIDGFESDVKLEAKLIVTDKTISVNFAGTSNKSKFGINVPLSYTKAYTCFGLSCLLSAEIPNNAGSLFPFEIDAPLGSILNAPYPAAVCARHIIGQMLPDVVFGCLEKAIPNKVPAEGASCLWNITFRGRTDRGANNNSLFAVTAVVNGGTGARPNKDGLSATAYPSGVRGTPVEINEAVAPLLFLRKEYNPGSGGKGEYNGGMGQVIEIKSAINEDMDLLASFDRIKFPARGRMNGENGKAGHVSIKNKGKLNGKGTQVIHAGDIIEILTPGGAGLGNYSDRDKDLIKMDEENELI
ncbi:hydantoinase B/oxoprolinase family protein [Alphaproteobacteria bacterium]|nr:hydantoinase B/oxoprolinase family protein [Alphaproteobacteria bacterium]